MKILIIEDEASLARDICAYLGSSGYLCEHAFDYPQAMEKVALYTYDCILLDMMLPSGDGMMILHELKSRHRQEGVIIISARDGYQDKITGLQVGADDYLAKPFHLAELAARVHSVIRRRSFGNCNIVSFREIHVDVLSKTVLVHQTPVVLTRKELDLLLFFIGNQKRVISISALAEHLSGDIADMFDSHDFVYAHVKNLKRKLTEAGSENYLRNVYGSGYKWEA